MKIVKIVWIKNPLRILDCKIDQKHPAVIQAPTPQDHLNDVSKSYFQDVLDYLDAADVTYEIATKLVRGLDYYTHTVFEIEADIEGFGAQNVLGGGGRYQSLVKRIRWSRPTWYWFCFWYGAFTSSNGSRRNLIQRRKQTRLICCCNRKEGKTACYSIGI